MIVAKSLFTTYCLSLLLLPGNDFECFSRQRTDEHRIWIFHSVPNRIKHHRGERSETKRTRCGQNWAAQSRVFFLQEQADPKERARFSLRPVSISDGCTSDRSFPRPAGGIQ